MLISANMATFPARRKCSLEAIESIYDQVDVLRIYLNEYDVVPTEYQRDKIEVVCGPKDLKSSGKVLWAKQPNQYYFCVDDDILYPPDYVERTLRKLDSYNNNAIVSYHGRKFKNNRKVSNYFKGYQEYYHFKEEKVADSDVEVIGNGVSCWNTNNVTIDLEQFSLLYMDDIFVSLQANQQGIRRIVLEHEKGFLRPIKTSNESLYHKYYRAHEEQTKIFNSVNWWK